MSFSGIPVDHWPYEQNYVSNDEERHENDDPEQGWEHDHYQNIWCRQEDADGSNNPDGEHYAHKVVLSSILRDSGKNQKPKPKPGQPELRRKTGTA
ncbi:MAG: hypothetical protein ABSH00_05855 [Bryobacteraceae bacterium]